MTDNTPMDPNIKIRLNNSSLRGLIASRKYLEDGFRKFLFLNEDVPDTNPDIGFLLYLIENQRSAIINLEERVKRLEDVNRPVDYRRKEKTPYVNHMIDQFLENDNG